MSSKVLETTYKIYKGQGNYLNKMEIFFFFVFVCGGVGMKGYHGHYY